MQNSYKKITASLLLFSHMLTSCYNPNIGMGKKSIPQAQEAAAGNSYHAEEPHDKYPPSYTLTTADKHPVRFTYHNGQWQAEVKEYASNGFWQHRQVPVVFEPGLRLEDVVDSNPAEQKQLLHLCPSEEEPDQPGYVYVGRAPMPQPQLLSSLAARQTTPRNEVGLAQQQATTQPQQAGSSPQQAQEQEGPQAVLALPSPVQQIGEGPRSQEQLPTTPARVISNSLSIPSRETPRQRVAQKQPTSAQQAPSRRALSWRNQHELLHSQRVAQAKCEESAAMAKPGNQLAQPAQPRQAIVPTTTHPPSLAHKAPQGIASQVFLAQGGHPVRFMHRDGQWQASVRERIGEFYRVAVLPVACERRGDVAKALAELQAKPTQYTQRRIHVMHTKQTPYVPQFVYLGAQGLRGGGNGADEPSGSGEPQDEPAAGGHEGAQGKEVPVASQAPADSPKAYKALREYYQQPDFAQVKSLFEGEAPKHVDALQCQLMLIEQVKVKEDPKKKKDHLSTHHERLEWVKNPIALEDLFKKRKTKPEEPEREIQKVLLVGEPGSGKTTLSRKIAYHWTKDQWGQELKAVYVLPVRALQRDRYDDSSMRRTESLATAIANNCFPRQNKDEEYERLRDEISEELEKPTTLVVLDGLDERYGASEKLIEQALVGTHKLLMLSRPYGIEQERTMVDIEIAHAGLSDGQMEAYVRGDLSSERGEELLQFIKEYPAIGAIAHVPVNLQILCALWKDDGAGVRAETSNGSLPGLYRMLTEYMWERYARERDLQNEDCEELFDTLGKIALDALQQGQVLISPELVRDHVKAPRVRDKLKESGFLLLQAVDSHDSQNSQYQFPHLTFQEYFAGRALAKQLLSGNAEDQEEVQDFFSKHKYERQYGVMLSFLSGEVSKEQGVEGLRKLLSQVQKEPQEVVGVQHVLLQMQLLNEWLCVAGADLEEELAALEGEFHVIASLKDWFGEGVDQVRRKDDHRWDDCKLLSLLTPALQRSRAVAAQAPALGAQVLLPLLQAMRDDHGRVSLAARSALGQVVQAAPAAQVLPPLLQAMQDKDDDVRSAASEALGQVVQAVPALGAQVLPSLLQAMGDDHWQVRIAVISALGQVVQAAPALGAQVLPPLLQARGDDHWGIRSAASEALGQVVQAAPALGAQVLPPLLQARGDSSEVVQAAPAAQVLPPLLQAMRNSSDGVRRAASEALGQVVQATPALGAQVLSPLLQAMRDKDDDVRRAASSALGQVVQAAPELAAQVLPPLLQAMRDDHGRVRRAASEALGQVVQAAPALGTQVLPPLLQAMRDSSKWVRRAASEALGQVVQAAPALGAQVLPPLLQARRDKDDDVRRAASEALGKFSLQQLIKAYWTTQNQELKQGFIPIIAMQLYQTPLVVRAIPHSEEQRLILYPTVGKHVKWEKPYQEVQCFVQQIQGAAKQWTPLMSAAEKGQLELAQSLVDKEADVNQATTDGRTPLWIAAQKGHLAVVQYLQEAGANIEAADKEGRTPLMIAAQRGHLEVARFLVDKGADVNQATTDGRTPLWIAAQKGHLAVVQYLQEAGANIEAADKEGRTPLMIATQNGYAAVAQFLEGQAAQVNP